MLLNHQQAYNSLLFIKFQRLRRKNGKEMPFFPCIQISSSLFYSKTEKMISILYVSFRILS